MKKIKTEQAVGAVLCHDVTQIIYNEKKDTLFRKGHIVREEDIEALLSIGKEHLFVWEPREGFLHENDAAEILCEICSNENIGRTEVKEGKIELFSEIKGLLKIDLKLLIEINSIDEIIIAARHNNSVLGKGDRIAGTRVIPLIISEEKLREAKELAKNKRLFSLLPFKEKKAAIITTGSEVFKGRIKDAFGPVITEKLREYDAAVIGQTILRDEPKEITGAILDYIGKGADLVICTGGMSVDPDDTTPTAIKNTGADIVSYGAPVLPGAMLLVSYYNGSIPVIGLPGCAMYSKRTVFDLILPRLMADDRLTKRDIAAMSHGGLCLNCEVCRFPVCGFGKC